MTLERGICDVRRLISDVFVAMQVSRTIMELKLPDFADFVDLPWLLFYSIAKSLVEKSDVDCKPEEPLHAYLSWAHAELGKRCACSLRNRLYSKSWYVVPSLIFDLGTFLKLCFKTFSQYQAQENPADICQTFYCLYNIRLDVRACRARPGGVFNKAFHSLKGMPLKTTVQDISTLIGPRPRRPSRSFTSPLRKRSKVARFEMIPAKSSNGFASRCAYCLSTNSRSLIHNVPHLKHSLPQCPRLTEIWSCMTAKSA